MVYETAHIALDPFNLYSSERRSSEFEKDVMATTDVAESTTVASFGKCYAVNDEMLIEHTAVAPDASELFTGLFRAVAEK